MTATAKTAEDQVRELAGRDDWRERVAALGLSDAAAHALRVLVLRERAFGATTRGAARAKRRAR